jgi:hypothetical protein
MTTLRASLLCRKETTVLRHLCADDLHVFEQQAQFKGETCTEIVFLRTRVDA